MTTGHVQRAIAATFEADPSRKATVAELAAEILGGTEMKHIVSVHRALRSVAAVLGLTRCRIGSPETGGWHHVWGLKGV